MSFYLSAQEVIDLIQGRVAHSHQLGIELSSVRVTRLAPLGKSQEFDLAFFFSKDYQADLMTAHPTLLLTGEPFVEPLLKSGLPLLRSTLIVACSDPYGAMAVLSAKFAEALSTVAHLQPTVDKTSIHPTAVVAPSASLGQGVRVGPYCVIEEGAQIGDHTVLYPSCFVGPRVKIGKSCILFPHVTLYENTQLGDRVRVHSGTVIGGDGFGYAPLQRDGQVVGHQKIYHLGRVVIGDEVEIGSNSSIDRATLGETQIGPRVKIDNQVQIGHNCIIEEGAVICGSVGLAGGARVGRFAYIGGHSGLANQVYVKAGAKVAGMTGIYKDVPEGSIVAGNPQRDYQKHWQVQAMLNRLLTQRKSK